MKQDPHDALTSEELLEAIAAVAHQRWAHWQRYLHEQCQVDADGNLIIPANLAQRWTRQMDTAYADLDESEKDSDREQAREYLKVLSGHLRDSE